MSDLFQKFAQQMNSNGPLANIGPGIGQFIAKKREEERVRLEQERFQSAYSTWQEDSSKENYLSMYEASPQLFELQKKGWDAMDEYETKNTLQRNGEVLSLLGSGDNAGATEWLRQRAEAYGNSADPQNPESVKKATQWKSLVNMAEEGEFNKINEYFKIQTMASGPEGQELVEGISAVNKDTREEGEFALKLMETGFDFEGDQDALDAAIKVAENDTQYGEHTLPALRYAKAVDQGYKGSPTEFNKLITGLNDDFFKRTEGLQNATVAESNISTGVDRALAETDPDAKGILDLEVLQLFQRQIDDATVRKDDVENIKDTNDFIGQIGLFVQRAKDGSLLSDSQRIEMKRVSEELLAAQKTYVDDFVYPSLRATQRRMKDDDQTYTEVFGDFIGSDRAGYEKAPEKQVLSPEQKYLIDKYPDEEKLILENNAAFLEREYKNSLADFRATGSTATTDEPTIKVGF